MAALVRRAAFLRRVARPRGPPAQRLLSAAPPPPALDLPLPDVGAMLPSDLGDRLRTHGYAVVDGAVGETWCHVLRDDIITLYEKRLLGVNATHIVKGGETSLLAKRGIFEAGLDGAAAREACPWLRRLVQNDAIRLRLGALLGARLERMTLKVQLNGGGGACFPLHFDSDPTVDGRLVTAILYLNPDWVRADGGELVVCPFPHASATFAPVFDRLVLFSSSDVAHRVLPSTTPRCCLTMWFYEDAAGARTRARAAPAGAAADGSLAPLLDAETRRLLARCAYADEWERSLEESHDASAARDAAVQAHRDDCAKIEADLAARGLALADFAHRLPLSRDDVAVDWFFR